VLPNATVRILFIIVMTLKLGAHILINSSGFIPLFTDITQMLIDLYQLSDVLMVMFDHVD